VQVYSSFKKVKLRKIYGTYHQELIQNAKLDNMPKAVMICSLFLRLWLFEQSRLLMICRRLERSRRGISDANGYNCSLVALMFLALGRKLLSQPFLFRFFFSFHLFLMCDLSILLFTSRYTRHKSQPPINNRRPS
jgi:hypothetical protein